MDQLIPEEMNNHTKLQQLAIAEAKKELIGISKATEAMIAEIAISLKVKEDPNPATKVGKIYQHANQIQSNVNKSIIWIDALNTSISE